jgi:twitching motility protein PilT
MDSLMKQAFDAGATDIHLCVGSRPVMRVNSRLIPIPDTDMLITETMTKIVEAYLDKNRLTQLNENKVVDFAYSKSNFGRFRSNVYMQRGTYAIAIRALPFDVPSFGSLGLPDVVRSFIIKRRGLVLVTGSTGSGKSTTLASMIDVINSDYNYHILTIEDPVEYLHKHKKSLVTQREIGDDAVSFSSALRSALREDPDVVMVGEMRDMETIAIALNAAETGHLVLSTLHTTGAVKTIDRIIDSFPSEQQNQIYGQLATVLEGVVSQQLIPRSDREGTVLACEVLSMTPAVRNLIRENKSYQINNIIQMGEASGMQSMERDLSRLCREGSINEADARLRSPNPQLFDQYFMSSR